MEELSEFLKDAYLNTSAERDSFTVDRERQKEITLQTLREVPDYFAVHLLAAAGLWRCREIQVAETELPGYVPLLRAKRWRHRFFLEGCNLQVEQLNRLSSALNDQENPALKRLALTLYQLSLGEVTDITLKFTEPEAVHFFLWTEDGLTQQVRSSFSSSVCELEISFVSNTPHWGKDRMREAACWSPVSVSWQGEPLVKNYREAARRQCLWWGEVSEDENYEVEAYLPLPSRGGAVTVVGVRQTVPLEPVRLDSMKMEESFFPGLVLVIRSHRFQVDGSQRRLVVNDNLMRLLRDVIAKVKIDFRNTADGQDPLLRDHIADHPECFPNLSTTISTQNYKTDPYLFRHGYAILEEWQDFGCLQGVVACESFLVSSLYFGPNGVTARHRSYPEHSPQGVAGHPRLPITAIRFRDYLEVWDEQQGACLFSRPFPGLTNILFTRDGIRLVALTSTRDVLKAWTLTTRDGVVDCEPILVPKSHKIRAGHQVLLLSDLRDEWRVLRLDGSSKPQRLKLPTGAILWQIDPTEDLALFSYGEQSYLVNLLSGQVRNVPGTLPHFHSQGRILTHSQRGLAGTRQVTFYSKQLVELETASVKQHYSVSDSGVIAQSKHPCGSFLNNFVNYSYPCHPIFDKPSLVNFDGSQATLPGEPLLFLKSFHAVANSQTMLTLGRDDWEEIYRMREPALALTPTHLAWQVGEEAFVISRRSGQTQGYDRRSLYKSLLTEKVKNRITFQSLEGFSKRDLRLSDGPWWSHRHLGQEGFRHQRVQVMPISLEALAAVCCQTGECLVKARAFRLEVNHRWVVKTKNSLLGEPTKVYARLLHKGTSWRLLGRCSSYALHPQASRLYYLDREGAPKRLDLRESQAKFQNATTTTGWITTSPSGRYLSVITPWQKTLYCSDSLQPLWHLNNSIFPNLSSFSTLGSEIKWCNDRCIQIDGLLYRSDEQRGWAGARRVSRPVKGALFTDGQTDLALRSRAGLVDLFCLKTAQILATLHVDHRGWFAFTPDGQWECVNNDLEEITPRPRPDQHREGLLKDLIAVDD